MVGCLATWDQSSFKQTVVRGYGGRMRPVRPVWNVAARVLGAPRLPAVGEPLCSVFFSHVAADGDDCDVLMSLIAQAYNQAWRRRGVAFATLGFADEHPVVPVLKRSFRHIEYRAALYLVFYDEGAQAAAALNRCMPHLEIAAL
jgi:hypothetical protein